MKYKTRFIFFFGAMILFNLAANFAHPMTPTIIQNLGLPDYMFGLMLAATGAVKEDVLDLEELACRLMQLLWQHYPDAIKERYGVEGPAEDSAFPGYDLLMQAGRKRGFLLRGNEINTERMAKVLLDEYRSGKLGFFTLEMPEDIK